MSELLTQAVDICRKLIGEKNTPEINEIEAAITNITYMPLFKDIDQSILKDMLLSLYTTKVDTFQILEGKERREPWLKAFKAAQISKWSFWTRYKKYLAEKKSFAPSVISHLDELTDKVLDKLFNPQQEDIVISKKGLVVGQVQSGKTANYTGLVCKAADAGFNLIIVLAGIHNNLRSQTQTRLDEGFLGFDTQNTRAFTLNQTIKMGVGRIPGFDDAIAHSYTTSLDTGDFTKRAANTAGFNFYVPQPIVLVVKKNSSVLKNLRDWLKTHTAAGKISVKSMLLIDDEADNASVNTNKADKHPTRINGYIRDILGLFNRSAYVGYTATPFANIFIPLDDSDLFPRDFIINLPAPDNYIGPEKVFGTSAIPDENDDLLPIVNTVDDSDYFVPPKHRKDDDMPSIYDMPESLKTAIKCFIITCAIRAARGQEKKHNSMLIHITRFQSWQNHIKDIVEQQFRYYKSEIEANDPSIMEEFRRIFEEDNVDYKSYTTITEEILSSKSYYNIDSQIKQHTWEEIQSFLYPAVQKIEVKSINGSSGDSLTYYENEKNGISVIAIGGDKLSRGLTLEGLSVSYFLRASKMYDTLMQMGRWFGYRPGYVDLCRLFTSNELNEWYRHITLASEELREEFKYLAESGGTPENYALKVRSHPGQLQITSVTKMRYTKELKVSWAGRLIETYQLLRGKGDKRINLVATDDFLCKLGPGKAIDKNHLWTNVSAETICDYLMQFKLPKSLTKVPLDRICEYITALNGAGELTSWSVALMSKGDSAESTHIFSNGIKVGCFVRNRAEDISDVNTYYIRKNHIVGNQCDEFIDLESTILSSALEVTKERKKDAGKEWDKTYPAPDIVRQEFRSKQNPLLIIYPLNPKCSNVLDKAGNILEGIVQYSASDEPFIGLVISFPGSETNHAISYVVNQVGDFVETEDMFDENNDNVYAEA